MKPLVLTFSETGQQLMGVSARTVRRMVENGELPVVRIGARVGIPSKAVEEWVALHTEAPCPTSAKTRRITGSATPILQAGGLAEVVDILTTGKPKPKKTS